MLKEPLTSTMEEPMAGPHHSTQLDILDSYPSTTSTDINSIPSEILESIFHDAKNISQTANGIVQMPGCDDSSSFLLSIESKNMIHSKCIGLNVHPCLLVKLNVIATIVIRFVNVQ